MSETMMMGFIAFRAPMPVILIVFSIFATSCHCEEIHLNQESIPGPMQELAPVSEIQAAAIPEPPAIPEPMPGPNALDAVGFIPNMLSVQEFPKWLTQATGMTEWPGLNPPYIPLDFIDFDKIPTDIVPHVQGTCLQGRSTCSFDCYKCVSFDDVYTCPKMSQTFDDGPTPATSKLLRELKHRTTFFTLGINIVRYPDIYQDIQEAGHLLASHTWSHPFLPGLSNEQIIAQFEWSIWAMNATGHHIPKWYRPPFGGIDNRVRAIARQFGMQAVLWDYDTFDWKLIDGTNQRTESMIINDVKRWKSRSSPPKGLILEHDGSFKNVETALEISKVIGPDQMTVSECVDSFDYIKVYN